MIIRLPSVKAPRWTGPYLGNYEGLLWRTFNVDFDRDQGHVSLSSSFLSINDTNDTDMTHLGVIDNFTRTDADGTDRWWALNRGGRLAHSDTTFPLAISFSHGWGEDALDSTPTDAQDMTIHENDSNGTNNKLIVTRASDVAVLNDTGGNVWQKSWWVGVKSQTALKGSVPHPIEYFPYQRISCIGDGNLVHTIASDQTITYQRITLPVYLRIWGIVTTPSRIWFLCEGLQGRNGAIVEWDGFSQTYLYVHDGQSSHVLSGVNYFGVPIVVNSRGLILEYNGNSFQPMMRNGQKICFASYEESDNAFTFPSFTQGNMYMAPRGMAVTENGLIHIAIQGPFFASQRHFAGIWCLNPALGRLYLKYAYSLGGSTDFGHQVFPTTNAGIGAIKATGVDAGASFGVNQAAYLLGGGKIFTNYNSVSIGAIFMAGRAFSGESERRGHFITQYIQAQEIQEQWDAIWIETTPFKNVSYDKIVVKARGVDPNVDANRWHLEGTVTWTSTTTFTVQLGNAGDGSTPIAVGDEIEVIGGKNAGFLAHITVVSGTQGAVQTCTIDETMASGSGGSLVRFDRWKKLGTISNNTKYSVPLKIGITSSFIQLKIEMRGFGDKSYKIKNLFISTVEQTKAKL